MAVTRIQEGGLGTDSFNLPITLNGTDGSSTDAGDNIVLDASASGVDAGERLLYEGIPPTELSALGKAVIGDMSISGDMSIAGELSADGNVGIGASDFSQVAGLSLSGGGVPLRVVGSSSTTYIQLGASGSSTYSQIAITGDAMMLRTSYVDRMNIEAAGNVDIKNNLLFGTSGKGVYLGVTTATAANLLDDYEEGTWTPAFVSTSATFGYTTQGGNYTKVGRMCLLTFRLELNGSAPGGTTSNTLSISGLPFATATLADSYHGGSIGHYFSINLSPNDNDATAVLAYQLSSGASTTELKVVGDNLGETAVLASTLAGASEIRGQIVYQTA